MRIALAASILSMAAVKIDAAPLRLGIMGDSLSAGSGSVGQFPNWHTQLSAAGRVTVPAGANRAVDGATSSNLASQRGQIVSLVQAGQLDYSVLMIGGNDARALATGLLLGGSTAGLPTSFSNSVIANIDTTLAAVAGAGPVRQVVANIPDITATPLFQSVIQSASPALISQFRNTIEYTNDLIVARAFARGIPVFDVFSLSRDVAGHPPLVLAGVSIGNLFTSDNFHPAPILHGLFANMFIEAANKGHGAGSSSFSDQQLVASAGFTPLLTGPTYFDLSQYILVPPTPGDFDSDGDVDGADFIAWQTNFPATSGHTRATGDTDGDGDVDGADFAAWRTNFPHHGSSASSPVPEPSAVTLAILAVSAVAISIRFKRKVD